MGQPTYRRATALQARSTDSAGRASLRVHTDTDCGVDSDKVKMVDGSDQDIVLDTDKEYYGLLAYYNDTKKKGRVQLHEYGMVDESVQQMFLCEKETDWTRHVLRGTSCSERNVTRCLRSKSPLQRLS